MSQALLESVRIPCSKSSSKEWYNVVIVEKVLQILFAACQYGTYYMYSYVLRIQPQLQYLYTNAFSAKAGINALHSRLLYRFLRQK